MATGQGWVSRSLDRATTRRVGRTLSAQAYGQAVTIVVQIALVPLLLRAWGVQTFGAWLVLSAVPFYLTFSDFGFTYVAKNAMVMAVASGRRDEGVQIFHSIFALLCFAALVLIGLTAAIVLFGDVPRWLALESIAPITVRVTLLLLVANVLLYQFFLLVCAGIRSENRPASEAAWAASARLMEGLAVAFAAIAGGGLVAAASAMVAARLLALLAAYRWLRRLSRWLRLGVGAADRATLAALWRPALAYMLLPLAQAMLIQGPVLIVGGALGAASAVIFSTSRTVTRIGVAAINMINNSVTSEYAALAGAGKDGSTVRLLRAQAIVTLAAIAGYALMILLAAPIVLPLLTNGEVQATYPFLPLLVAAVAAEMLWSALFTPVAALNRHGKITAIFLILSVLAITAASLLAPMYRLSGVAAAILCAHGVMIAVTLKWGHRRAQ